uniref:Putative conserved secreted protein n=1 Tax=Ixodes ricinus TaxID=34613 RepID=A0A6B0UTQ3_IXORI
MKNTGLSFFIIQTARLIVAMLVLLTICKPIAAGVDITGVENLAPNCKGTIKALCNKTKNGKLQKITVTPRKCEATCTYKPDSTPNMIQSDGVLIRKREHEIVHLPNRMPCAFGAECKNGNCICKFCNENINGKKSR